MGFKYTHRVYNDVQGTTATEQQVLALLAHFADDRTGQCFPSIETLARQSHLHRATVIRCLDSLKQKGFLKWLPGGRKKKGRVLSNLYKLTLPKPAPKREETVFSEFWEDVDNSPSSVAQRDPYPSHSATLSSIDHLKIIPGIITRRRRAETFRDALSLVSPGGMVRWERFCRRSRRLRRRRNAANRSPLWRLRWKPPAPKTATTERRFPGSCSTGTPISAAR